MYVLNNVVEQLIRLEVRHIFTQLNQSVHFLNVRVYLGDSIDSSMQLELRPEIPRKLGGQIVRAEPLEVFKATVSRSPASLHLKWIQMKSEAEPAQSLTRVLYGLYELEAQIVQWLQHLPNFNRLPDRKRAIEYDEELTICVAIFHHVLILARALKTKLGHYKGELRWFEL